jgi:hypothetical protein
MFTRITLWFPAQIYTLQAISIWNHDLQTTSPQALYSNPNQSSSTFFKLFQIPN